MLVRRSSFICVNGRCINCKRVTEHIKEYAPCKPCYYQQLARKYLGSGRKWREIERLWEDQGGICPYTGIQLELGIDASLDHILPSSRFPELAQDIANMEFIHYRVNEMKRDWTKEEFMEFLNMINIYKKDYDGNAQGYI